jgi:hypothetical protein
VNLVGEDPPQEHPWSIMNQWYKQALRPARVEIEMWVFKQP